MPQNSADEDPGRLSLRQDHLRGGSRSGEAGICIKTAESGNRRAQAFCPDCGSRLWATAEKDPQFYNLRIGGVKQRAQLAPKVQAWCNSALPWSMNLGALRQQPRNG